MTTSTTGATSGRTGAPLRIGAGQGAFGESAEVLRAALEARPDYVVCDSLAETTCGFFALDRRQDESRGFAPDLVARCEMALPHLAGGGMRLITNGGALNPIAGHQHVVAAARAAGYEGLRVGLVVHEAPPAPAPAGEPDALAEIAYLGAAGIVEALAGGADLVITGRVADAALFLAPAVHEHAWRWDDWDRLAAGVVVGHLLECTTQVTGGNYSGDWWDTVDLARLAPPIAEVEADGSAVVTKPPGTGGRVSFDTVREQLLYEVHDPTAYVTPDVVADFTSVRMDDLGHDRVRVSGARGAPRPEQLRCLRFSPGGVAGEATVSYAWPDAEAKARHVLRALRELAEQRGVAVLEWHEELFGVDGFGGPTVPRAGGCEPPEVTARLAWRTASRDDALAVGRLVALVALAGPPGLQGIGRRTRAGHEPADLLRIEARLVDRAPVESGVRVLVEEV